MVSAGRSGAGKLGGGALGGEAFILLRVLSTACTLVETWFTASVRVSTLAAVASVCRAHFWSSSRNSRSWQRIFVTPGESLGEAEAESPQLLTQSVIKPALVGT